MTIVVYVCRCGSEIVHYLNWTVQTCSIWTLTWCECVSVSRPLFSSLFFFYLIKMLLIFKLPSCFWVFILSLYALSLAEYAIKWNKSTSRICLSFMVCVCNRFSLRNLFIRLILHRNLSFSVNIRFQFGTVYMLLDFVCFSFVCLLSISS